MVSVLDVVRVGWCPLGIQSLGFPNLPFVLYSLWGSLTRHKGEFSAEECLKLFENTQGFGVGSCTGRLVFLRNSISRTPWHSLCPCLLVGSLTRRRAKSSLEEWLNLFENTQVAVPLGGCYRFASDD